MTRYRAAWVVPIVRPPIQDGWVEIEGGAVTGVGSTSAPTVGDSSPSIDLGLSVILPGLVNAHTHLELSGLRNQVLAAADMPTWARRLMARVVDTPPDDVAVRAAVAEARGAGTAVMGDVSNTLASVGPLNRAAMPAVVFKELLGFDERDPAARIAQLCEELGQGETEDVRLRLAAHAPYSVSAALFAAIRTATEQRELWPLSVHAGESREELEFLQSGTGVWRDVLAERGRWDPQWQPPATGAVEYLDQVGWLGPHTLLVHGVQLTDRELARVCTAGATIVTCPRSNQWTGAGVPPLARFYASGVRVAIGTDSLASVDDLNMFGELREIRRLAPSVPAAHILRSATVSGAEALGFGAEAGRIAPGARASLIVVRCAAPVDDVEEYLLGGIQPEQIAWLEEAPRGSGC